MQPDMPPRRASTEAYLNERFDDETEKQLPDASRFSACATGQFIAIRRIAEQESEAVSTGMSAR